MLLESKKMHLLLKFRGSSITSEVWNGSESVVVHVSGTVEIKTAQDVKCQSNCLRTNSTEQKIQWYSFSVIFPVQDSAASKPNLECISLQITSIRRGILVLC